MSLNFKLILLKFFVEFLGTFTFLSIIVNTLSLSTELKSLGTISVSIGLLASIFFGARVTGAHFNPAVSVMLAIKKIITPVEGIYYISAQILGGIFAAYFDSLVMNLLTNLPS